MEERDGGFAFFWSHECNGKAVSGEASGGATCSACQKRFYVELVSQVVRIRGELRHACSEECRRQILAEADGARLGSMVTSRGPHAPESVEAPPPPLTIATASAPSRARRCMHAPSRLA